MWIYRTVCFKDYKPICPRFKETRDSCEWSDEVETVLMKNGVKR